MKNINIIRVLTGLWLVLALAYANILQATANDNTWKTDRIDTAVLLTDVSTKESQIEEIEQCENLSNCTNLFKQWENLGVQEKIALAKKFVSLVTDLNGTNKNNDRYYYQDIPKFKLPNENLAMSLETLIDANYFAEVKLLLDQYELEIPKFEVRAPKISDTSVFIAKWYISLLIKENSATHIRSSTFYVNRLTLSGVYGGPISKMKGSTLRKEAGVLAISLGLLIPFYSYRHLKAKSLYNIRADYLQFLDQNGYESTANSLRRATTDQNALYEIYLKELLTVGWVG